MENVFVEKVAIKITEEGQAKIVMDALNGIGESVYKSDAGKLLVKDSGREDKFPVYIIFDEQMGKWYGVDDINADEFTVVSVENIIALEELGEKIGCFIRDVINDFSGLF